MGTSMPGIVGVQVGRGSFVERGEAGGFEEYKGVRSVFGIRIGAGGWGYWG